MTPEEVAYTAGIFDGEGTTATFLGGRNNGLQFIASISQKDVQLLKWIQESLEVESIL